MSYKTGYTDYQKYGELLKDPKWDTKRKEIISRDHGRCVCCGSKENLEVHHRQYHFIKFTNDFKKPWEYPNYIYVTLCKSCHKEGHKHYKVPVKYI